MKTIKTWGKLNGGYDSHEVITPPRENMLQRKVPFENPALKKYSVDWWKQRAQKPFVWTKYTIYKVFTQDGATHIIVWTGNDILIAGSMIEGEIVMNTANWPGDIKCKISTLKELLP